MYAELGVEDYRVIDAKTLATRVYRDPLSGSYRNVVEVAANEPPLLVAPLTVALVDLGRA